MRMLFMHCRSFYVGDAAGRPDDHSDADIKFAQVCLVLTFSFKCIIFMHSLRNNVSFEIIISLIQ